MLARRNETSIHSIHMRIATILLLLIAIAGTALPQERARSLAISVEAGDHDRRATIVSVVLPLALPVGGYVLSADDGREIVGQVDAEGVLWFVVDDLPRGERRRYLLEPTACVDETKAGVAVREHPPKLEFEAGGRHVLSYMFREHQLPAGVDPHYAKGGYLHPVYTPAGLLITDALGPGHTHHSGVWSAWAETEFRGRRPDFWNIQYETGRVDADSLTAVWDGPVMGGFRARHRYVDLSGEAEVDVLLERWEVLVYDVPNVDRAVHVFDVHIHQEAATDDPLTLLQHRYGGIGFRGHRTWFGEDGVSFLTSDGHDRRTGNETRARWAYVGGTVDGRPAGVAILSHPSNPRHPEPVRMHPDAPFFNYAPTQLGPIEIDGETPFVAHYRFVAFDGEPDADMIERWWVDFASPPRVVVVGASRE